MSQGIDGVALNATKFSTEAMVRVLGMQKQAMDQQGENTLKLIQAAGLPPEQGKNLDVSV